MADDYDEAAKGEAVLFDDALQAELLVLSHQICEVEGWRFEASGNDPTHNHQVISWRDFVSWEEVDRRVKNLLTLKLNRRHNTPGKRWFVRRHSAPRRVENEKHFQHLLETYLPDHPGLFWKRGMKLPELRDVT
jgi:hypothetical protein